MHLQDINRSELPQESKDIPMPPQTAPLGIRIRLLLLAAACVAPMFGLVFWDSWKKTSAEIESTRLDQQKIAQAEAASLERSITSAKRLMNAMAKSPSIANPKSPACSEQLALLAATHLQIGNAFVFNKEGETVCRATPNTNSLNVSGRTYFKQALTSSDIVIGDPVSALLTKTYILPLAFAIRDGKGEVKTVISATINLNQFAKNTEESWVHEQTVMTWWTQEGRITFRWPEYDDWVGKSFSETPLGQVLRGQATGHVVANGTDGIKRIHGFSAVGNTGITLNVSIPQDVLLSKHHQGLQRNLAILSIITLSVLVLAWFLGELLIRRPLLKVVEISRRMSSGDLSARCGGPYSSDEIGALSKSFDEMSGTLALKIEELQDREQMLKTNLRRTEDAESRVRQQLEHMTLLDQITRSIGERLDLNSIFQVVVRALEDNLPVDFCCVAIHDTTADALRIERVGLKSEQIALPLMLSEKSLIGIDKNGLSSCMKGKLVHEPDIAGVSFPFPERLYRGGLRSLVLAPLKSESSVFGVLVAARTEPKSFSSIECEFLRQLSEHVALGAEQAQLHGALQQAYDDLRQTQQVVMQEERLRALGQMASGIAHDINNALSPVSLYTESLLENEPNLSDRARNYLETISRAVEDVAQTVARMREFYRKRESQVTLTPVNLNRIVEQVIDLTKARWSDMPLQRGVVIGMNTELPEGLPSVMGVASEIREALTNLIFNAVDAMPEGGSLTIRTKMGSIGGAEINAVAVEVIDEGVGMDEETRRRCMEPFFTTKGERGTGLGLAMVFGMMQRHSADLEIDSIPGKGTTMRLLFALPSIMAEENVAQSQRKALRPMRLLLIDDDPVLIKSLRDALESDRHAVVTAYGGKDGIIAFQNSINGNQRFDAVITDLGMPYVDGRKVAAEIKALSPETPVLMLTGWGQRLVADGDIPPHVDRVLSKPPRLQHIREALAIVCKI